MSETWMDPSRGGQQQEISEQTNGVSLEAHQTSPEGRRLPIDSVLSKLLLQRGSGGVTSSPLSVMSSTLVETVSIDYEDFNESFLTCGTCLCMYDGASHTPKLMPCSHTVCLDCLSRIVASNTREPGTVRCPICRALITLPSGGVSALPPSFVVNQLLDLMARQRREVVPKCATHQTEDLLFCETCDSVFCAVCADSSGDRHQGVGAGQHTIVPFSLAIKRMSEILLYKANECSTKLNKAHKSLQQEISALNVNVQSTTQEITDSFQQLSDCLQQRKHSILASVEEIRSEKQKILEEQLTLVDAERTKVQNEYDGLQCQVEVSQIARKINELSDKLDTVNCLCEPRENSFIKYELANCRGRASNVASGDCGGGNDLQTLLSQHGRVRTSRTFPGLCEVEPFTAAAHLCTRAHLVTHDYHGTRRQDGGDPVSAELSGPDQLACPAAVNVHDCADGRYRLEFRPRSSGVHVLHVRVFGRPVKFSPFTFNVSEHNDPVRVAGSCGVPGDGDDQLSQPVGVAVSADANDIYVADTGNCRLKVYNRRLQVVQHLLGSGLEERAGTGVALCGDRKLALVNWRSRKVTVIDRGDGRLLAQFSHQLMQQPIAVAAGRDVLEDHVLVADSGLAQVLVFGRGEGDATDAATDGIAACVKSTDVTAGSVKSTDAARQEQYSLVRRIGSQLKNLTAVASAINGNVITAGQDILVFSPHGSLLRQLVTESNVRGVYGGVTCDELGNVLATRSEKSRHYVQVFSLDSGKLQFWIDSDGDRLRRPAGLCCSTDGCVFVADLANHCLKQYRYL